MNSLYFHNEISQLKDTICFELEREGFWSAAAKFELTGHVDRGFGREIDSLIAKYDREKTLQAAKFLRKFS